MSYSNTGLLSLSAPKAESSISLAPITPFGMAQEAQPIRSPTAQLRYLLTGRKARRLLLETNGHYEAEASYQVKTMVPQACLLLEPMFAGTSSNGSFGTGREQPPPNKSFLADVAPYRARRLDSSR